MDIGLIGCGRVANLHMCAYKHIPRAQVVAVSDIRLQEAKAFAQRHGVESAFKDYSDLLEMKTLDYVDICTPTSTHAKIACEAAEFGHNILLEKPMARKTSDCNKIINKISKHKVKLCICHNQLFTPGVIQAKSIVDSGEFDLIYFRVSVKENTDLISAPSWVTTQEQGGLLWETGCHSAYLQLNFLKDIDGVLAVGSKIKQSIYDHFAVLLHTSSQALGVMEVSYLAKRPERVLDFMSSDGKRMQIQGYDYLLEIPENIPQGFLKGFYYDQKNVIGKWKRTVMETLRRRSLQSCLHHYNLISKYIQSIEDDSDPPVTPEDGRKTIGLLECIEESLNENRIVKMKSATH